MVHKVPIMLCVCFFPFQLICKYTKRSNKKYVDQCVPEKQQKRLMNGLHSEYSSVYGVPLHQSSPVLPATDMWHLDTSRYDIQINGTFFDRNEPNRMAIRRTTIRLSRFNVSPMDQTALINLIGYGSNDTSFDVQNNAAPVDTNQVKQQSTIMSKFHAYLRDKVAHFKKPKLQHAFDELEALRSQLSVKDKIIEEMVSFVLLLL